jgi:internalin A
MTDPTTTPSAKRRKRFGLSLRVLMVLVLLLGGGMGWYAYRARVQREAVAAIEAAGGKVYYDWEWNGDRAAPPTAKPKWPKWLMDRVGPDYLGNVVAVFFDATVSEKLDDEALRPVSRLTFLENFGLSGFPFTPNGRLNRFRKVTDAGMAHLRNLSRLKYLLLQGTEITGPAVANLEGMRDLRYLNLNQIPLGDQDARYLRSMTRLESLFINGEHITDSGMESLAGLTSLKVLSLDCPEVTTAGLQSLRGMSRLEQLEIRRSSISSLEPLGCLSALRWLRINVGIEMQRMQRKRERKEKLEIDASGIVCLKNLQDLSLAHCNIVGKDLTFLAQLSELTTLDLRETNIDDRGLGGVASLPKLTKLSLGFTNVSDKALPQLYELKKCELIDLQRTEVTAEGVRALKQRLPSVRVAVTFH